MMHFRIHLLMHGKASEISGMKVHSIPGYIQLPQMKPFHLLIKGRKTVQFHSMILKVTLPGSIEGSTWFDGDAAEVKLQNAILQLPEKQRIVFNLKYFDDMTYEEMSKILNTSVGALKASYHHAVKKIEILIAGD